MANLKINYTVAYLNSHLYIQLLFVFVINTCCYTTISHNQSIKNRECIQIKYIERNR